MEQQSDLGFGDLSISEYLMDVPTPSKDTRQPSRNQQLIFNLHLPLKIQSTTNPTVVTNDLGTPTFGFFDLYPIFDHNPCDDTWSGPRFVEPQRLVSCKSWKPRGEWLTDVHQRGIQRIR